MKKLLSLLFSPTLVLILWSGICPAQPAGPSISSYILETYSVQPGCGDPNNTALSVVGQTFELRWDASEFPFNDPTSPVGYWKDFFFVIHDNPSTATIVGQDYHGRYVIQSFLGCIATADAQNVLSANRQAVNNQHWRLLGRFNNPNNTVSDIYSGPSPILRLLLPNEKLVPTKLASRTKDPVNIANGEMTVHATDFSFPTQGPVLQVLRVYRSYSGTNGAFGYGWHSLLDARLTKDADGNVILYDEEGTGSYFNLLPDGNYIPSAGNHAALSQNANGTFTLTTSHGIKRGYGASGRLTSITDRNDNTLSVSFDPLLSLTGYLQDATVRRITLVLDSSGRLIEARDPLNRAVNYFYDSSGNLTTITDALGHSVQYSYDTNHHITQMINPNGHKTYFAYDAQGRVYQHWQDDDVNKVALSFQNGGVTLVTDALGNQSRYQFNEFGVELSRRDALNRTTTSTWDNQLNRTSVVDPLGRRLQFMYDSQGNLLQTKDASNQITSFEYTSNFNLLKRVTDALGGMTSYEYDTKGNRIRATDALGHAGQMTYDARGNLLTSKDPLNNTTLRSYNQYGQLVNFVNALNQATSFTYDVIGNIITATDAAGHRTSFVRDTLNRLTRLDFADGTSELYAYDAFGNKTVYTDPNGRQTISVYDIYERLTTVTDLASGNTQLGYDKEGRKISLTDAQGRTTTFGYDAAGQLILETNPLNQSTAYSYDASGNLVSRTDANNHVTTYSYDSLNRQTRTGYADGTFVSQIFDSLGRRTSMTDRFGTTIYSYDLVSQRLSEDGPGTKDTVTYAYDANGNRISLMDQDNREHSYAYDALGRLKTLTIGSASTQYDYDTVGNLISIIYPNTGSVVYSYDSLNRRTSVVNASSAGNISSFQCVYDPAGQLVRKALADGSVIDYSYDAKGQLVREIKMAAASAAGGPYDYFYLYDSAGNRTNWVKTTTLGNFWTYDSGGMPQQTLNAMATAGFGNTKKVNKTQSLRLRKAFSCDAGNRVLSFQHTVEVGGQTFFVEDVAYMYDSNGSRTGQTRSRSGEAAQVTQYSYDLENRLTNLVYQNVPSAGIASARYTYDGDGRRTKAVEGAATLHYVYNGSDVILERDTAGTSVRSYVRAPGFRGGIGGLVAQRMKIAVTTGKGKNKITTLVDKDFYSHYDALGSITDITDDTGTVSAKFEYDAFGNKVSESDGIGSAYQFSTKEWEGHAGLSFFGGRYYDPSIGRWLTSDPLGLSDGPNVYVYAKNNPLGIIDAYGAIGEKLGDDVVHALMEDALGKYASWNASRLGNAFGEYSRTSYRGTLRGIVRQGVQGTRTLEEYYGAARLARMARVIELGVRGLERVSLAQDIWDLGESTWHTAQSTAEFADKFEIGPVEILGILPTLWKAAETEVQIKQNIQRQVAPFVEMSSGGACDGRYNSCFVR